MTDGLNAVWSIDRAAHTDTNPKNLELAPPQSVTATRLDQLVYSPKYYIQIFQTWPFARSEDWTLNLHARSCQVWRAYLLRYGSYIHICEYCKYIYLCNKYNIAHSDWYRYMPFITNMICTEYTNHQYDICKTITELCELRDGVAHRGVVNRTDICSLLEVVCTDYFLLISLFILFIYFNSIIIFIYILFVYNCIFCVLLWQKYVRIKE